MIFVDKEHFKTVLNTFCIQEEFPVIHVDPRRFIAVYSSEGCEQRVHASRFPDGVTWAIKTLKNPKHTCSRLEGHNPLRMGV